MTGYETYTTERLMEYYLWEKSRVNKEDMAITQATIRKELKHRFNNMMRLLDDPDLTTDEDAEHLLLDNLLHTGAKRGDKMVVMSADDWSTLICYIHLTYQHRKAETAAWETLAAETKEDGTPRFPNAVENAKYFSELDGKLARIVNNIESR